MGTWSMNGQQPPWAGGALYTALATVEHYILKLDPSQLC